MVAGGVARRSDVLSRVIEQVHDDEAAKRCGLDPEQDSQRQHRLHRAQGARHRPEHAGLGAVANHPVARGLGPHAAEAGPVRLGQPGL
jgi:hypothetical protein